MTIRVHHHTVDRSLTVVAAQRLVLRGERANGSKWREGVCGVSEQADAAQLSGHGSICSHGDVVDNIGVAG